MKKTVICFCVLMLMSFTLAVCAKDGYNYESAGFTDFYQRELKNKTPDVIRELYRTTFDENDA